DGSLFPTPTRRRRSLSESELIDFEDLELLDSGDLRAVLEQAPTDQVLAALGGTRPTLRSHLLTKLSAASASKLEEQIKDLGPVSAELAEAAQRALVEILRRLSRGGQIAFDDPDDMA